MEERSTGVLIELGALLLALGLLGRLAVAVRLSPIPLYLLAVLVLGAIDDEPITFSREVVDIGADVGVALLLLIAGIAVAAGVEPELGALAGAYVLLTALAGSLLVRATQPRAEPV